MKTDRKINARSYKSLSPYLEVLALSQKQSVVRAIKKSTEMWLSDFCVK